MLVRVAPSALACPAARALRPVAAKVRKMRMWCSFFIGVFFVFLLWRFGDVVVTFVTGYYCYVPL